MCLWLSISIIRYGSRVKKSNLRKRVAPSFTFWRSRYWKREPSGRLRVAFEYGCILFTYVIDGIIALINGKSEYHRKILHLIFTFDRVCLIQLSSFSCLSSWSLWYFSSFSVILWSTFARQYYPIYPTPPPGQDMTPGQFFKAEFNRF